MNISEFQQCSNCGACYNICPQGAISVKSDGLFYAPTVDERLCVDCSKCVGVCPVNQEISANAPVAAFGGWHKDHETVMNSSSGGVFCGIAQFVINKGGAVYAAVYSDDFKSVEVASSDDVPIRMMMKSKYVESSVGMSFQRIGKELDSGRTVLFVGTPCQTAGLHRYLGRDYDNLITCDFACGGLPSHDIYRKHISALEQKYASKVRHVDCRYKSHGWKRYVFMVSFQNGKRYLRLGIEDPYLKSFLYGKCTVREYCMDCKFPEHHLSDISLADFWRHKELFEQENPSGISLILCNTPKGRAVIDSISDQFEFAQIDVDKASYNNHIRISEKAKARREAFLRDYEHNGLTHASQKYVPFSAASRIKHRLVRAFLGKRGKTE